MEWGRSIPVRRWEETVKSDEDDTQGAQKVEV